MSDDYRTVADEATELVRGPRARFYGAPWVNFERIALKWTGHLHGRLREGEEITTLDVACMMADLKTARASEGYHRDSIVDVIGYMLCAEVINDQNPRARESYERDVYGEPTLEERIGW